jgi:N-methylhydantoinase A
MSYRIGIDVGGTFTDLYLLDESGHGEIFKTPSTPHAPADGVLDGLREIAASKNLDLTGLLRQVGHIIHGTTITTNAVLTRRGGTTAVVTTRGFRDLLLMRRGIKDGNQYDYRVEQPQPLVPRERIFEITERVNSAGEVAIPLAEDEVHALADQLAEAEPPVEAVAVSYLWSFAEPDHERRTARILRERLPGLYVSTSSEVLPQVRMYERTSTTALNAYVGPILSRYLDDLSVRLETAGFTGALLIVQSNGGVMSPELAARFAANTLLSGPAGGPEAGLHHGRMHGLNRLITVDMGGTSFDVALIDLGRAVTTTDAQVAGFRLALPVLDIHTIGAGGGSIAHVDDGGLLAVGPQSAGSAPGPACYGRGGTLPTTTDADLLLGYIDPASFAGGRMPLDVGAARKAISTIADQLGQDPIKAAAGVYDVVNHSMANAVRFISIERGLDPREFALAVAGGAGPLHAGPIARELEIPLVLIPRESSVFCASGMAISDVRHDYVRSLPRQLDADSCADANRIVAELAEMARQTLRSEGVAEADIEVRSSLDLRYVGQFNEVETPSPSELVTLGVVEKAFHIQHDGLYGYSAPGAPLELLNVRVRSVGRTQRPPVRSVSRDGLEPPAQARLGQREAWFDGAMRTIEVYAGLELRHGNRVEGPAVVEQPTTTVVVPPGYALTCDAQENYVLHPADRSVTDLIASIRATAERDMEAAR